MKQLRAAFLKTGYTLMEVVVVIVIIGTFVSIAIPSYTFFIERMINSEGKHLLLTLFAAQKRYALDHNGTYADQMADLDITIPQSNNFCFQPYNGPIYIPYSSGVAEVFRKPAGGSCGGPPGSCVGGDYSIGIDFDENIWCYCCATGVDCELCHKLGYNE